jgi:hypothetical protein
LLPAPARSGKTNTHAHRTPLYPNKTVAYKGGAQTCGFVRDPEVRRLSIMISFDQALQIRNSQQKSPKAPAGAFIERDSFWWFPDAIQHVGSCGIIIDKADGHLNELGSGLGLEEWFYAHELGFRHRSYLFRITGVRNVELTLRLLWDIRYTHVRSRIDHPPLDLDFNWMCYRFLPRIVGADFFDYEFSVSECEYVHCTAIGSHVLRSKPPAS